MVSVWRGFLFWLLGMGYVILLWHSLSLPLIILCAYQTICALPDILCLLCGMQSDTNFEDYTSLGLNKVDHFMNSPTTMSGPEIPPNMMLSGNDVGTPANTGINLTGDRPKTASAPARVKKFRPSCASDKTVTRSRLEDETLREQNCSTACLFNR